MAPRYDLIVIGGGFQGVLMTLEATRRGLDVLLVEKGRLGCGTSDHSLRVVHGGFRYLQSLDLGRYRRSQREQSWFLEHLPDLVRPLRCVLPLDGTGLRRPAFARAACAFDAAMGQSPVPRARVLSRSQCHTALGFQSPNVVGAIEWHDAVLENGAAVVGALASWARALGAQIVEGAESIDLVVQDDLTRGVRGSVEADAPVVVVAAGVANDELAARFAGLKGESSPLSRWVAGFNVVLKASAPFAGGFGFRSSAPGSSTFFCLPRGHQSVVGTLYGPVIDGPAGAMPPHQALVQMLTSLEHAVPGHRLRFDDIAAYDIGVLPAGPDGSTPADRPMIVHARDRGGPQNLWFVTPEKLTTARAVAENVLKMALGPLPSPGPGAARRTVHHATDQEAVWPT